MDLLYEYNIKAGLEVPKNRQRLTRQGITDRQWFAIQVICSELKGVQFSGKNLFDAMMFIDRYKDVYKKAYARMKKERSGLSGPKG